MNPRTTEIRTNLLVRKLPHGAANHDVTVISAELSTEELQLLITLASDQLFRREFIDPKMPGYKAKPGEIGLSKILLGRLRSLIDASRPNESSFGQTGGAHQNGSRRGVVKSDGI